LSQLTLKEGIIIESTGSWAQVLSKDEIISSRLVGKQRLSEEETTHPIAVGDRVTIALREDKTGTIQKIHERKNAIPRLSTHTRKQAQILVANLDMAWVVQAVKDPRPKPGFIDRFLVTCEAYGVPAGIILNKKDLMSPKEVAKVDWLKNLYTSLRYPVILCSAESGEGIEELKSVLKDKISALIGPSGTGKSSLLNRLDPKLERSTSEISSYSGKGRHTTTFAQLVPLQFGGMIADTPGIKEFGLVDIEPWELSLYFPEMVGPREECKFNTCTHEHEPGCGVMKAFEDGKIDPERYNSYLMILESLKEK